MIYLKTDEEIELLRESNLWRLSQYALHLSE